MLKTVPMSAESFTSFCHQIPFRCFATTFCGITNLQNEYAIYFTRIAGNCFGNNERSAKQKHSSKFCTVLWASRQHNIKTPIPIFKSHAITAFNYDCEYLVPMCTQCAYLANYNRNSELAENYTRNLQQGRSSRVQ